MPDTLTPASPNPPMPPVPGQTTPPPSVEPDSIQANGGPLGVAAISALGAASKASSPTEAPVTRTYLDEQGNPIPANPITSLAGHYVDEQGNPISTSSVTSQNAPKEKPTGSILHGAYDVAKAIAEPYLNYQLGALKELAPVEEAPADRADRSWAYRVTHPILPVAKEDVALHGSAEHAGAFAENVLEFIGGDEALKGLALAEKFKIASKVADFAKTSPKIAKAIDIGMTALRQGTVSGVQTAVKGGTAEQVATNTAVTGAAGFIFGAAGAGMGALYRNVADHSPEAIKLATQAAKDSGEDLANKIAQKPVGSAQANVEEVTGQVDAARLKMQADYSHGLALVTQQGKNIAVPIAGSSVEKLSQDILADTTLPEQLQKAAKALGAEDSQIEPMLQEFATGKRTYGWTDMENFRQIVGNRIRDLNAVPGSSTLVAPLTAIRDSIDDTMQKAAETSGNNNIAAEMKATRERYAVQKQSFNATAIKSLLTSHPDSVADLLLDKGETIYNVSALKDILTEGGTHPEAMKSVEAQVLKRLIYNSSTSIDGFNPSTFVKQFNTMGPDVQQAIWGDVLPQIQDVMNAASNIPRDSVVWGGLARYMEHRGLFDAVGGVVGIGALTGAATTKGNEQKIFGSAAILGVILLLHDASALKFATTTLQGVAKAATPAIAGTLAQHNTTPPEQTPENNNMSENTPVLPPGYVHVKTSDGSEFHIPAEHLTAAQGIDKGLQLLHGVSA